MAFAFMSGKAAALVGIFSNHLTLTLNRFDSMRARIDASSVIIECSRNDFRSRSIMTCTRTKSEFGARVGLPTRSELAQAPVSERSRTMNIEEIKQAVKNLSREDLGVFRKWFWEFDQERWDEEIEEDVKAGRFDSILREVDRDAPES